MCAQLPVLKARAFCAMDVAAPRPVIFLDVDGVLANARSALVTYEEGDETLFFDPSGAAPPLERRCVEELRRVIEATGAAIVISSTWRLELDMRRFLMRALAVGGIDVEAVVAGDTPEVAVVDGGRGAEVCAWLAEHPITAEGCVILDDGHAKSFAAHGLGGVFVQTELCNECDPLQEGLTRSKADEAIRILTAGAGQA